MPIDQILGARLSRYTRQIFRQTAVAGIEFFGSGLLAKVEGKVYLFSAAHVLDHSTEEIPLFVDTGKKLVRVVGDILTSRTAYPRLRSDDRIDMGIVAFDSSIEDHLADSPILELGNLDVNHVTIAEKGFVFMGHPESKNREVINEQSREIIPFLYGAMCQEASNQQYVNLGIAKVSHLLLDFNKKRMMSLSGEIRIAPALNGLSGAPIWGSDCNGNAFVAAILTEHHKGASKSIVSTRIATYIDAARQLASYA